MKKGIIMEIDGAFLTLLTPEGEFLRTKKQDQIYSIGQEIHFFPSPNVQNRKSLFLLKNILTARSALVVMTALLVLFASFLPLYQDNKAYAYMSIDGNSSIELGVNKEMQVVKLTGFNKEGKQVISKMKNWKKKDVSKITQSILIEMKQSGLLDHNQPVIISTVRSKEMDRQSEKDLQKNVDEIKSLAEKQELPMTVLKATQKDRKQAQNLGISTGKYQKNKYESQKKEKRKEKNANLKQLTVPLSQAVITPGKQKESVEKQIDKQDTSLIGTKGGKIPPGQFKKVENQFLPKPGNNNKQQPKKQEKQQEKQPSKQQVKQQAKQQPKQPAKQQPKQQVKKQPSSKSKSVKTTNNQKKSKQKEQKNK
ncbi:anti-sigma factor domain-containing protein [Neobacillus drentensis]|uniref:anti-sigma factor domain-containing protein n=1 Tax=Neobacillus drentensis TaxID=220684 RepID=UPI002FFEF2CE